VAYVRKVRTASGAVAVQVARKDRGWVVVLAHVGSAHTDAELGILLEQARGIVTGEQEARRVGGHRGRACQARTLRRACANLPFHTETAG
jgi:hypothetical protein